MSAKLLLIRKSREQRLITKEHIILKYINLKMVLYCSTLVIKLYEVQNYYYNHRYYTRNLDWKRAKKILPILSMVEMRVSWGVYNQLKGELQRKNYPMFLFDR